MNEETLIKPITKEEKKEPKLTRQERRMRDRINHEASDTLKSLAEQFRNFFMANDPDGFDVSEKRREVDAKWRLYCKGRSLIPEAYPKIREYCDTLMQQYKTELDGDKA